MRPSASRVQVSEQKETVLQRRTRLADRRKDVSLSLDALRSDLNEEIEESLAGVKRGGKTLERALRQMRQVINPMRVSADGHSAADELLHRLWPRQTWEDEIASDRF